jgi:hypothetical protein
MTDFNFLTIQNSQTVPDFNMRAKSFQNCQTIHGVHNYKCQNCQKIKLSENSKSSK